MGGACSNYFPNTVPARRFVILLWRKHSSVFIFDSFFFFLYSFKFYFRPVIATPEAPIASRRPPLAAIGAIIRASWCVEIRSTAARRGERFEKEAGKKADGEELNLDSRNDTWEGQIFRILVGIPSRRRLSRLGEPFSPVLGYFVIVPIESNNASTIFLSPRGLSLASLKVAQMYQGVTGNTEWLIK